MNYFAIFIEQNPIEKVPNSNPVTDHLVDKLS